ncbi:MAG: leucine-rich repeat protein [Clostridia bacterium]|nr:leucine-rich repeat protein [Clostridia bacterium]
MKKALFLISLIIAALGITAHAQAEDFMYEIVDNEAVGETENLNSNTEDNPKLQWAYFTYEEAADIVTITGLSENAPLDIVIPGEINGKKVILAEGAFSSGKMESVIIENGITLIPQNCFYNCDNLKSVTLPDGITKIGGWAFYDCDNLANVDLGKTLIAVYGHSFANCEQLEEIDLPDSLIYLYNAAFENCTNLKTITLPKNLKKIESDVFAGCDKLTSVTIDDKNEYFSIEDGIIFNKEKTELIMALPYLTGTVVVPEGMTEVPYKAFSNSSVETVIMHDNITAIRYGAFHNCSNLKNITIPDKVTDLGEYTFTNCNRLKTVILGNELKYLYRSAFYNCKIDTLVIKAEDVIIEREEDARFGRLGTPGIAYSTFHNTTIGTIYGYEGSDAEKYANEMGIEFIPIDEEITIKINSAEIECDTSPYIKNNRTMVPMRAIFEALGAEVSWDDATKTAIGVKDGIEVKITIGENVLYKNGEAIELDAPAEITNDRTMVPVRAISEAFGCTVNWDNDTKTVEITN